VQRRRARTLGGVAVAGPALFTATWVVLGATHPGYVPRQETISSLSAHDVPGWPWMVAGQLCLAAGFAALAALVGSTFGRRGVAGAVCLALATYGTVQASAFRTICNRQDAGWCTPLTRADYPHDQWLHGTGTGVAFGGVLLSCLAVAYAAARSGRRWHDVVVWSLLAEAVALPHVVWFLLSAESSWHGLAEKVFLSVLCAWTAWCGFRLAFRPDRRLQP
jgi:hypothetical protein